MELFDKIAIFREVAKSALAGFNAGPLSRWNGNLEMLTFVEGGQLENPESNHRSMEGTNNKLIQHIAPGPNRAS